MVESAAKSSSGNMQRIATGQPPVIADRGPLSADFPTPDGVVLDERQREQLGRLRGEGCAGQQGGEERLSEVREDRHSRSRRPRTQLVVGHRGSHSASARNGRGRSRAGRGLVLRRRVDARMGMRQAVTFYLHVVQIVPESSDKASGRATANSAPQTAFNGASNLRHARPTGHVRHPAARVRQQCP